MDKNYICLLTQRSVDKRGNMCQPGADCERCGWEANERRRRIDQIRSGGLDPVPHDRQEDIAPNSYDQGVRMFGLRLKAEADAARVDI